MQNPIILKKAVPSDTSFIFQSLSEMAAEQNLTQRFFLTEEKLFSALFSEKAFAEVILAFSQSQAIGLVLFSITQRSFDLFNGPGIYIHEIYVQESFRRKKAATLLTQEVKKIALERKCSRLEWVILKDNLPAIEFFKTIYKAKVVDYINTMRIVL